jgi:archaellum biogenesis ATPase FlaH
LISRLVISHLLHDREYVKQVLPHLRPEYFDDRVDRALYEAYETFVAKYFTFPNMEALAVTVGNANSGLSDDEFEEAKQVLASDPPEKAHLPWLVEETEKYCRKTAVNNAVFKAGELLSENKDVTGVDLLLQQALAVSFNSHIGHDYFEDWERQLERYWEESVRLPFDLELLNKVTRGGIPKKSLSVFLAGTGVGKTFLMCHMAAANLMAGKSALYITLEMSEDMIRERIDANLMGIPVEDLTKVDRDLYATKIKKLREKTTGRLVIHEFPGSTTNVNHFRHLLSELKTKKNFVPDVVYIDYVNLVAPARAKIFSGGMNSYNYLKMAAEEIRGLAMEQDTRIVTATQTNRTGFENSDPSMTDTSDSFGLPMTADFFAALYQGEDLERLGQIMVVQLKNRWRDFNRNKRFVIGMDKVHMRLYDMEKAAQTGIQQAVVPVKGPTPQDKFGGDFSQFT